MKEVGVEFSKRYGVEHRVDRQLLEETLRLNAMSHLASCLMSPGGISSGNSPPPRTISTDIAHYFGGKLAERRRGGLILVGAMGAENGIPCMANDGAAKVYVHSLGEALHCEFKPLGVYITVLAAGLRTQRCSKSSPSIRRLCR
jgi:NAD(P)-dependent dehydrogenase (short-subunit alcohol dehydrogenase family)